MASYIHLLLHIGMSCYVSQARTRRETLTRRYLIFHLKSYYHYTSYKGDLIIIHLEHSWKRVIMASPHRVLRSRRAICTTLHTTSPPLAFPSAMYQPYTSTLYNYIIVRGRMVHQINPLQSVIMTS